MAYFFRDPQRRIPTEPNIVVAPADGKITRIEQISDDETVVSIFLSPIDVHINRAPIAGKITKISYFEGKFVPATRNDASHINERNELIIEGEKITVKCIQIAGILARRIVCWSKENDSLEIGAKFGMIKFSSRTDLILPKNVRLEVSEEMRVVGGVTIIGRIE